MPRIVDKLINPLVGLGVEAYAHHKNKSHSPSPDPAQTQDPSSLPQPATLPRGSSTQDLPPDYENDEEAWELDDASRDVAQSRSSFGAQAPKGNWAGPAGMDAIAESFLSRNRPNERYLGRGFELPVVIPQKRPHTKMRGFVRAYAPIMEECGIGQKAWLEFLECFHEAIKVSPAFDIINGAVGVVSMVGNAFPSATLQGITTAVAIADGVAKEFYLRTRTNTFLAQINNSYFRPLGLYCLLMSWKPNSSSAVETIDLSTTIVKAASTSDGLGADQSFQQKLKSQFKLLKPQDGQSFGDAEFPACAPLIYPDLDQASDEQKKGWFARGKDFTADYFDRRATAQYIADHPGSNIASVSKAPVFESQRGDPSSVPKNTGVRAAITGSEGRLGARLRQRRDVRKQWVEERRENPAGLIRGGLKAVTKGNRPSDVVKRVMHPDVVYMLVVRMPSEEELAQVRKTAEENRG